MLAHRILCSDFVILGRKHGFRLWFQIIKLTLTRCLLNLFWKRKWSTTLFLSIKTCLHICGTLFLSPLIHDTRFFFAGKSDLFCLILHFVYVSHSVNIQNKKKSMHDRQWHGLLKIKNHLTKIFNVAENNLITEFNKS